MKKAVVEQEKVRDQTVVNDGDVGTQHAVGQNHHNRDIKKKTSFMADFTKLDQAYPKKEL